MRFLNFLSYYLSILHIHFLHLFLKFPEFLLGNEAVLNIPVTNDYLGFWFFFLGGEGFGFETSFPCKSVCPEFTEFHSSIDTYLVNILTNSEQEIVKISGMCC